MEQYINQLVEELETVAKHPPRPSYLEPPPHLANDPVIAELAMVPFQTIEVLTGIKQEAFPKMADLQGDQWERINNAIFKVFESLHIDLLDAPPGIPAELLYDVLSTNWQYPVQYLPSSGMDFELCTGDPMTCPYGNYCECSKEWLEQHVRRHIWDKLNIITDIFPGEIDGLYDDDGTKIDPETVPLQSLCVICKRHNSDDPEEKILCLLNRYDQRDEEDFKCGMFEKI